MFFVLSGYVIAHATATRETTAYTYAVNRVARIYSVVLPGLVAMALLDGVGRLAKPEIYLAYPSFTETPMLLQYAASAVFLNQWWAAELAPGVNLAYWSLGYEIWYYVIFAAFMFAPAAWRWPAALGALVFAGPRIALLLPVWLLGVCAYHAGGRGLVSRRLGWLLFLGSIVLWACYEATVRVHGRPFVAPLPLLPRIEIPQDYLIGLLFVANLMGFQAIGGEFRGLMAKIGGVVRWAAGATFSLYLLHLPIAHFIVAIAPWPVDDARTRVCLIVGTLVLVFVFASVTERRKLWFRQGVDAAFSALLRRPATVRGG